MTPVEQAEAERIADNLFALDLENLRDELADTLRRHPDADALRIIIAQDALWCLDAAARADRHNDGGTES